MYYKFEQACVKNWAGQQVGQQLLQNRAGITN